MRIKLDENLPADLLLPVLEPLGHDVETVADEGLKGAADPIVREAARTEHRLLITQDLDFADLRANSAAVVLRLRHPSRRALARRLAELFRGTDPSQWDDKLVIVRENTIRVRQLR